MWALKGRHLFLTVRGTLGVKDAREGMERLLVRDVEEHTVGLVVLREGSRAPGPRGTAGR